MGHALQTANKHPCPHCGVSQPTAAFPHRNRDRKGIGWCRACQAAVARAWNRAHPARVKANQANYRKRRREKRQ